MNYKFRVTVANNNYDLVVGYKPITFSEYGYEIVSKSDLIQSGGVYYADITFSITNFENSQGIYEKNNLACLDEYDNTLPIETYAFQYDLGNTALVSWMESENKDAKLHAITDADRALVAVTNEIYAQQTTTAKVYKIAVSPKYVNRFAVLLSESDETVAKTIVMENADALYSLESNLTLTNSNITDGNGHYYYIGRFPAGSTGSEILNDGTIRFYEKNTTLYCNYFTFYAGEEDNYELPVDGSNYLTTYNKDVFYSKFNNPVPAGGTVYSATETTPAICQEYDTYTATKTFTSATDELMCRIFGLNPQVVYLDNSDNVDKTILSTETVYSKNAVLNPYGITVVQQS